MTREEDIRTAYEKEYRRYDPENHAGSVYFTSGYIAGMAEAFEAAAKVADANCEDEPYGHAKFRCVNIAAAIREMAKEMK